MAGGSSLVSVMSMAVMGGSLVIGVAIVKEDVKHVRAHSSSLEEECFGALGVWLHSICWKSMVVEL